MTIVNGHSHDSSSMRKRDLVDNADGDLDRDRMEGEVGAVVDTLPFLIEWGHHEEPRIHLVQETGDIVDYLVEECAEEPAWLKPELHHVPPETWDEHDV